jgi:hypothetical protein
MKTRYLLLSVVILMVILAGWYIVKEKSTEEISNKDVVPSVLTVAPEGNFSYECQAGKSAFDVLDEKAEVEYDESSFGKLVTSIGGKSQGDGKYWLYSIEDKEATVGATAYICQGSEEIKWELK